MRQPTSWIRSFAATLTLGLAASAAPAATDRCDGAPNCRDLGPFTATVVKVNVTRQDKVTAYQGVRTTVRFTNVGDRPLILGYRDHSSSVTDDKGLAYRWSAKAYGIGIVGRDSADPQFQLAPGQSREASFDGVVQYSMRRQVAGSVFSHDITIVQLGIVDGQRVREARDHVLSFTDLTASAGYAAAPNGPRPSSAMPAPAGPMPVLAGNGGSPGPSAAGNGGPGDCTAAGACQAAGPIVANVVRVNVTQSGSVTAYQSVRTTVRFTNASTEPVILGYRNGSGAVSDDTGQAYRWASKAYGIGVVDANSADPQFRLAPGESREAAFESTLQYSSRHSRPGHVFSHDMTIAQLAIVGPGQVRTLHDYALSFSNLSAGGAGFAGAPGAGGAADAVQTVNKVVDLFKTFKK
jgi:hypothetical protein